MPLPRLIILFLALSSTAPALAQSAYSSLPASTEPPADASGFQAAVSYGLGFVSFMAKGQRTLSKSPDSSVYEDESPLLGTFKEGSSRQLRTEASLLFHGPSRSYSLSVGLESLDVGTDQTPAKSDEGATAALHVNSLILGGGVQKPLGSWGHASLKLSFDLGLGGELRSRYRTSPADQQRTALIRDTLRSSTKLSIQAGYQLIVFPSGSLGPYFQALYGTLRFRERAEPSYLYGSAVGIALQLSL